MDMRAGSSTQRAAETYLLIRYVNCLEPASQQMSDQALGHRQSYEEFEYPLGDDERAEEQSDVTIRGTVGLGAVHVEQRASCDGGRFQD